MIKDIDFYKYNYFENDLPVPYELKSKDVDGNNVIINIYPIKVKDYRLYSTSKEVVEIDKNEIDNIDVIKMSYLDFIVNYLFAIEEQKDIFMDDFINLFSLILQKKYIGVELKDNKTCLVVRNDDEDKIFIKPKEVDDIVKISQYQNDSNYNDRKLSADIKKEIEEYVKIRYGNSYSPSLEEQKAFVISKTGILMKDINEMTYRSFNLIYSSARDSEMYIANKIIQASEKYETKEDVTHPLYTKNKDIVDEVFNTTAEQLESKISNING